VSTTPAVNLRLVAKNGNNIRLLTPESELEGNNFTTQRCKNKIIEAFLIENFFHLPAVCDINGAPSAANISANFPKILKWP
jgi:hypothetical protein